MYIFKSTRDPNNEYDISDVTFEIDTVNKTDLIEEFLHFLQACGYVVNDEDREDLIE